MTTKTKGRSGWHPATQVDYDHTKLSGTDLPPNGIFVAISCDCCGKRFVEDEPVYLMGFTPEGACIEILYVTCSACYPKMGKDKAASERAAGRAFERLLLAEWEGGGDRDVH